MVTANSTWESRIQLATAFPSSSNNEHLLAISSSLVVGEAGCGRFIL
jgi:hypothetical protein